MRNIINLALIAFLEAGIWVFGYWLASSSGPFPNVIIPRDGLTIGSMSAGWSPQFVEASAISVLVTAVMVLTWYSLGQWIWKVDRVEKAGKRGYWILFALFAGLACLFGVYLTWVETSVGFGYPILYFVLVFVACFWLATVLFSPSAFKYTPLGAGKIRRW